jgi:hypothetical protein
MNSEESVDVDEVCANCGIAPVDDIKLKICDGGCDKVKYCSNTCQENHRQQHDEVCKKRKVELHDKELFEQPEESHLGECPICFIPLPLDKTKYSFYSCCCKSMCNGCSYADCMNNRRNRCPFCREPVVRGEEENNKRVMERVKANDPAALTQMGVIRGKEGDYETAFEYFKEAAELGDASAHYRLGGMYYRGEGVEKDLEKGIHHLEKASICGNPDARHYLACDEWKKNDIERSVKHFIIAAKLGHEESMKALWKVFSCGNITKEELDDTLRTHKAAIDATKSSQRDAAEAYCRRMSGLPYDGGESTYIPPASPQSVSAAVMQGLYNNELN